MNGSWEGARVRCPDGVQGLGGGGPDGEVWTPPPPSRGVRTNPGRFLGLPSPRGQNFLSGALQQFFFAFLTSFGPRSAQNGSVGHLGGGRKISARRFGHPDRTTVPLSSPLFPPQPTISWPAAQDTEGGGKHKGRQIVRLWLKTALRQTLPGCPGSAAWRCPRKFDPPSGVQPASRLLPPDPPVKKV